MPLKKPIMLLLGGTHILYFFKFYLSAQQETMDPITIKFFLHVLYIILHAMTYQGVISLSFFSSAGQDNNF